MLTADILNKNLQKLNAVASKSTATGDAASINFGKVFYGMNETTGGKIYNADHINQSIQRILTTPLATKTMRREFGSDFLNLSAITLDASGILRIKQAINIALDKFEPRIAVTSIDIIPSPDGTITPNVQWSYNE